MNSVPSSLPVDPDVLAKLTAEDIAWLEARHARICDLLSKLYKAEAWCKEQPDFYRWLSDALKLLEHHLVAGRGCPAKEILLDVRWGRNGWALGCTNPGEFHSLEGLPMEWLDRVLEVAVAILDHRHGPLTYRYIKAGQMPANEYEARVARKEMLHRMHTSDLDRNRLPRQYWPIFDAMGMHGVDERVFPVGLLWLLPRNEVWRAEMTRAAMLLGLPHPDSDSRIEEWLNYLGPAAPEHE